MFAKIGLGIVLFVTSAQFVNADEVGKQASKSRRPVTVADTISMTQTGDQSYLDSFAKAGNVAYFSPDGRRFAFITKKGNLENDTVEYALLVFQSQEVFNSPRAELVAKLASSSNRAAITQLSWLPDNDRLMFIGENPGENPQLYRVSQTTRKLERLTDSPTPVTEYSVSADGNTYVYEADSTSQPPLISSEMRRRGFTVTVERWDALYQDRPHKSLPLKQMFFKTRLMKTAKPVGAPEQFVPHELHPLRVSPNGRFVLTVSFVISPPQNWKDYKEAGTTEYTSASCSTALPTLCPAQYRLVDLENGADQPLLNAPITSGLFGLAQAAWTRENSLLLVNTLLPLDTSDPAERSRRLKNVYAVEMTPGSGQVLKISEWPTPFRAGEIEADADQDRFVVPPRNAIYGPPIEFEKRNGVWKVAERGAALTERNQPLSVTLAQDVNTAPRLVASDPRTGKSAVVLDLNPQFAELTFGRVERFRWHTRDGRVAEGSLYYPPDHVPGRKYPLVIQTHGDSRERFWVDGPFTTAFAAQPLANQGFLVLQMGIGDRYDKASQDAWTADWGTVNEGPVTVAFFESAIDELDRRGLIDPQRVGLSGFSRTVYHVLYMLTHSDHPIAAAVVADGVHYSYANCVFYLQGSGSSVCEKENGGGPPYGRTLAGWEKSPAFNLDKVQAPLLLQAITAPLGEWEILAGLRWLHKPVEMLNFYPEGDHILVRPQQRLLSQGGAVDWYSFWLKGQEDADPAKAEQYRRWHKLREQKEGQTAQAEK